MLKCPPKAELRSAAQLLRRQAEIQMAYADAARERAQAARREDVAAADLRFAQQAEARAARWRRAADWMTDA